MVAGYELETNVGEPSRLRCVVSKYVEVIWGSCQTAHVETINANRVVREGEGKFAMWRGREAGNG